MSVTGYAAIIAVLLLILMMRLITAPIRFFWKLLLNTACGFASIVLLNLLAGFTGIAFALNWVTAAVVAVLGLPGVGALLIVRYLLL